MQVVDPYANKLSVGIRVTRSNEKFPSRRDTTDHSSSNVEILGSCKNGMAIISPPNPNNNINDDDFFFDDNNKKKKKNGKKKKKTTSLKNQKNNNNTATVIAILKEINTILQQRRTKKKFEQWIQENSTSKDGGGGGDNSVRYIQGGRMEIFLKAIGKSSAAFDAIVGKRLSTGGGRGEAKKLVLEYAKQQAMKDPRFSSSSSSTSTYKFDNFSLICSTDMVDAQAPHIDLIRPNYQFGLMVSENSTSTLIYDPDTDNEQQQQQQQKQTNHPINNYINSHDRRHYSVQTVDQLIEHWEKMAKSYQSQSRSSYNSNSNSNNRKRKKDGEEDNNNLNQFKMPDALVDAMKREPTLELLLRFFGNVLLPARYVLYQMKKLDNLPTGTLLSLPGSVIHAAPATASFRAVIFFSGCPETATTNATCPSTMTTTGRAQQQGGEEYNPDTQYTGVMLAGHITSLMWNQPGIGFKERMFLLQRLAQYVEGSTVFGTWGHFPPGNLANFVGNIELFKQKMKTMNKKIEYITKMADSCQTMGNGKDPFSEELDVEQQKKEEEDLGRKMLDRANDNNNDDNSVDNSVENEDDDDLGMANNFRQHIPTKEPTSLMDDYDDGPPSDLEVGQNDLHEYELVSVHDLYTLWEDEEYHVEVVRRIRDGKIVLRYPTNSDDDHEEYEGSSPSDNFRLIMKEGYQHSLFDGRNGDLLDTEGELIDVYQGRGEDI